jgi:hypothetical protein
MFFSKMYSTSLTFLFICFQTHSVDLPDKMFLRKGASYRLLGSSSAPELMEDHSYFKNDDTLKRFALDDSSRLKEKLCNADANGKCQYATSVTLDSNLGCVASECDADTLRVVQVSQGIYYEYVRPACVEQAFYANAKKVIYRERWSDSSCANPRLPYASEACCSTGDLRAYRSPDYLYDQERVLASTADSRCVAIGKMSCDFNDIGEIYFLHDDLPGLRRSSFTLTHDTYLNDAITGDIDWYKKGYHWSTDSCTIKAKVNAVGQVSGRSMKHRLFYVQSTSLSTLLLWPAFRSHWCMSQKTTPTFILTFAKITGTSSRSTGTAITRKTTTMFQLEIPVEMESVNLSHLEAACAMLSYQRLVFSRTCQQAWSKYSPN